MFGNKKGLEHKLSEQGGVVAEATIIDAATLWTSGSNNDSGPYTVGSTHHCEVKLKVEPEGEPPFEATLKQAFPDHIPHPGQQAKVIYDPNNRSKIAIMEGTMTWAGRKVEVKITGDDQLTKLFGGLSRRPPTSATG